MIGRVDKPIHGSQNILAGRVRRTPRVGAFIVKENDHVTFVETSGHKEARDIANIVMATLQRSS
jgi:hypothetical protein